MEVESVMDIAERAALAPLKVPAKVKNTKLMLTGTTSHLLL